MRGRSWLVGLGLWTATACGAPVAREGAGDKPAPPPPPMEWGEGAPQPTSEQAWNRARARMVETQIEARGVHDPRVLEAMRRVPRHRFVPDALQAAAYDDTPLPIGSGQTISQPFIVAYMTEALALEPQDSVLEIGTGSGYQAAVLAELVRRVYTVEIVPELAERAAATLRALKYANVDVRHGDGYLGWPEHAPYDAIIVTAAPDHIPGPLVEQLASGGRLVIPVGTVFQEMRVVTKTAQGITETTTIPVRFVPLVRKP